MYFSYLAEKFLRILLIFSITTSVSYAATINSPSPHIRREITAEEFIFVGTDGRVEVISRKELMARIKKVPIATAMQHHNNFTSPEDKESSSPAIEKRCQRQSVFTLNPVETFLNWDVPMSPVVLAPPNDTAYVNIDQGHSISEKLSVSVSRDLPAIKEFLRSTLSINYERFWLTDNSIKYSFEVPPGKFGAVVSNPLTTRHSGWVDIGCIGKSERTRFSGDSYQSMVFKQMPWVEGVIGLCIGDTFPLKRCLGNGTSLLFHIVQEIDTTIATAPRVLIR